MAISHPVPFLIAFHRRLHCTDYSDQLLFSPYTSITSQPTSTSSCLFPWRTSSSPSSSSSSSADFIKLTSRPLHLMLPPKMTRLEWPHHPCNRSRQLAKVLGSWKVAVRALGPLSTGIYCVVSNLHLGAHTQLRVSVATGHITFCNPVTRDYKFTNPFPPESISLLSDLARQPCRVHYGFGTVHKGRIGYLPHDYKVVVVMSWGEHFTSFLSFVYSLRRGAWEKIADYDLGRTHLSRNVAIAGMTIRGKVHYPEIDNVLEMCPQRFFNGSWHWMAVGRDFNYTVLSFHMAHEVFKLIGGPPSYIKGIHDRKFVKGGVLVLNDHLAAIYFTVRASGCRDINIDVWMMMEYGIEESWTKIYAIKPTCMGLARLDAYDLSSSIYWNTLGLSAYSETLEPLNIQVEDTDRF